MRHLLEHLDVLSRHHFVQSSIGRGGNVATLRNLRRMKPQIRCIQTDRRLQSRSEIGARALQVRSEVLPTRSCSRLYSADASVNAGRKNSFSVPLEHRGLIAVVGTDAAKFLQGLTTNNITFDAPPESSELPIAQCNAFLNAQGRVLQDALVYALSPKSPLIQSLAIEDSKAAAGLNDPCFLVEVDREQIPTLLRTLKRYKLRSKIVVREVDSGKIGLVFHTGPAPGADSPVLDTVKQRKLFCARDERAPGLGYRILASPEELAAIDAGQFGTLDDYRIHRYLQGVPEGQDEIQPEHAMVQESNLDLMSGVDFRKGCYVGQELVIRTQHTGVVRKRVLPVLLYDRGTTPPEQMPETIDPSTRVSIPFGSDIKPLADASTAGRRSRSAGKWIANVGNLGIALARLETMAGLGPTGEPIEGWQASEFTVNLGDDDDASPRVKAFVPQWWASRKAD